MKTNVPIQNIISAWKGHEFFADWLVKYTNPNTIVDLGVDFGFSTFAFAIPEIGHVYAIDCFEGDHMTGTRNTEDSVRQFIADHSFNNITVIKGFFSDVAKSWSQPIDILHIDGLHTYEAVKNDFVTWTPFVNSNGIILMHDVCVFQGVRSFYNEIALPKAFFPHSCGLGIASQNQNLIEIIVSSFPNIIPGQI